TLEGETIAPRQLAVAQVQRGESPADAELAPAHANVDFVLRDQRRHRLALAEVDVGDQRAPDRLAGVRIQRDGLALQRVEDDLAIGEDGATIHHVAAGNALRGSLRSRLEGPFGRPARL